MKKIYEIMKKRKGVTLVELVITMGIIGILLTIAVPNYVAYTNKVMEESQNQTANRIIAAVKDASLYARNNGGEFDLDRINRGLVDVKIDWTPAATNNYKTFVAEANPSEPDTWGVSIDWTADDFKTKIKVFAPDGTTKLDWEENWTETTP